MLFDILILTNGPGEVSTWVRPVVRALREQWESARISVVVSPCLHAMGTEAEVLRSYPQVDRVQAAEHFLPFLLLGKTAQNWDWSPKGIVLFLGGDQFFALVLAKRLGYKALIYAETEARWYRWVDGFAVINAAVVDKIPPSYRSKLTIVGDLMVDLAANTQPTPLDNADSPATIALLMGSKPGKLRQGVPLMLAIADYIYSHRPSIRFIVPVAPTVEIETLRQFADAELNPIININGWGRAQLLQPDTANPYLQTEQGLKIELIPPSAAQEVLAQSHLAITTVGANTAELAALNTPMIVLLPTQQLDTMRSWDGLPGILANLPGVGSLFAKGINWVVLQQKNRLYAWPNIWAKTEIVPELLGKLEAESVGNMALDWLAHPEKLQEISDRLQGVCGQPGAAKKIAHLVGVMLE